MIQEKNKSTQALEEQVLSLFKQTNRHSIETRKGYLRRTRKVCRSLKDHFGLEKFVNLKEKHILWYIDSERLRGISDQTIRADIEAVKFFYKLSGGKNILPETKELGLERKDFAEKEVLIWTDNEIQAAFQLAEALGRRDIAMTINLAVEGKTLDEIVTIKNASGRYVVTDNLHCDVINQKKIIRNWIHNNRHKFSDRNLTFEGLRRQHNEHNQKSNGATRQTLQN